MFLLGYDHATGRYGSGRTFNGYRSDSRAIEQLLTNGIPVQFEKTEGDGKGACMFIWISAVDN